MDFGPIAFSGGIWAWLLGKPGASLLQFFSTVFGQVPWCLRSSWFIAGTGSEVLGRAGEIGCHLCLAWCPVAISDGWKSEYVRSWSLMPLGSTPARAGFSQPGLHVSKCLQFVLRCFRGQRAQCKEPGLDGFPFLLGCYICNRISSLTLLSLHFLSSQRGVMAMSSYLG